jgi:uncharacterized protein
VDVVLHGGEPLLLPPDRLRELIARLRAGISPVTELRLSVQTNGVRLSGALGTTYAELFLDEGVRVGISLDGGRAANDRHRVFRNGASSYRRALGGIALMTSERYRPMFAGLLCTVDVANDPVRVFTDLAALRPPRIDLLLPHATWEHPPPAAREGGTPYGDWLCAVFDHWYDAPPDVGIRLFEELINALLGGASHSEAIGRSAPQSLVIETDGSIEQTDALKVAYEGAAWTGYDVFDDSLDDVLADPLAVGDLRGNPSPICRACSVFDTCGGGLYPHRYRPGSGFSNPSVYCHDLKRLIEHVAGRLERDLTALRPHAAGSQV